MPYQIQSKPGDKGREEPIPDKYFQLYNIENKEINIQYDPIGYRIIFHVTKPCLEHWF